MQNTLNPAPALYRIGAVSKLSGVPVPTLRVWQTRYSAFSPATTQGQHRLYSEEDLRKAALLKALTSSGHGIRLIAGLQTVQLQQLLHTGSDLVRLPNDNADSGVHSPWALVGQPLAERLQSRQFLSVYPELARPIGPVWSDLREALDSPAASTSGVLMVSVNTLNDNSAQQILALSQHLRARLTVVFYGFSQMKAMASLNRAGCLVHREPLSDAALADIVRRARPALPRDAWALPDPHEPIPARRYSDSVLQRVASIPSQVLCECPRHVAELIGQLGRFEDYSLDCLEQSPKDQALHTQLHKMAATARAMFETALQVVAEHEGISLTDSH